MTLAPRVSALALAVLAFAGCRDEDQVVVPNRVLDRPLDAVLACVKREGGRVTASGLSSCAVPSASSCGEDGKDQLVGFVANSERNEIAMFRRCRTNGLVDLDPDTPGYNFLPAGSLPSKMAITRGSCRAISANYGSCDFTVVDVPQAAAYALELQPSVTPSSLVATVIPRRSDGTPLGSRPGDIIAVPPRLSLATSPGEPDGSDDTGDGDAGGGDTGDGTGGGGDVPSSCEPDDPASVIVTFPTCHLVAEVDLLSQQILQSRRIVFDDEGNLEVIDSGLDPQCPVDCPGQLDGELPDDDTAWVDGMSPMTLALVPIPGEDGEPEGGLDEDADGAVLYDALFVGGPGADTLVEIPIDDGVWGIPEDTLQLTLEEPKGVHVIRPTPAMTLGGIAHQFLYVVAGDGSTHVVSRDFGEAVFGVECDTQVDPPSVPDTFCHPIDPFAPGDPPDRRALAVGPGIRSASGGTINDWTFQRLLQDLDPATDPETMEPEPSSTPFVKSGVIGVGVTSQGRVVMSVFGQFTDSDQVAVGDGLPTPTMDVTLRPHMLWPAIVPYREFQSSVQDAAIALPRVVDQVPTRALPEGAEGNVVLAPSLRRIDFAYAAPDEDDVTAKEREELSAAFGGIDNVDQLGGFEEGSNIYSESVVRVVARDWRQYPSQEWDLSWEGEIPGAAGSTGRMHCKAGSEGWQDSTCISLEQADSQLIDESATFCEQGVLAGDKVIVLGCLDDDDCGLGQVCLRQSTTTTDTSGICVSSTAASDDEIELLREVCRPFIDDPCGQPIREFTIVRAFQDRLFLQAMDRPFKAFVRPTADGESCPEPGEGDAFRPECIEEHEARFVCAPQSEQPDGGCESDQDCADVLGDEYFCIEGVCRTPCMRASETDADPDECAGGCADGSYCFMGRCFAECDPLQMPLPGPACFSEFVSYRVHTRNSFVVRGRSIVRFLADGVRMEEVTVDGQDLDECVPDPDASRLLTSRIRLGANEDETFNHPVWGVPECPADSVQPGDPNPCKITLERPGNEETLYHLFPYHGEPVQALRFSNPVFSFVLDLTSLVNLGQEVPDSADRNWPTSFVPFRRSRIPRGYRVTFATASGYTPYNEGVFVNNVPMVYPVRIMNAPMSAEDDLFGKVFIVDAGGRGGTQGVRGQVLRVGLGAQVLADDGFQVR